MTEQGCQEVLPHALSRRSSEQPRPSAPGADKVLVRAHEDLPVGDRGGADDPQAVELEADQTGHGAGVTNDDATARLGELLDRQGVAEVEFEEAHRHGSARIALDADVHVLLSLRDDFLMHCNRFDELRPIFSELTPNTLADIAGEKAGIIKPGVPVISGVTQPEPRAVIERAAQGQGCRLIQAGSDFEFRYRPPQLTNRFKDGW